jgi:hypothetical protein
VIKRWVGIVALVGIGCSGGAGKAPGPDGGAATTDDGGGFVVAPLPALPVIAGRIVVTPAAVLLTAAVGTAILHAEAFGADGQKMTTATFTWESSRPADVTVGADGQLTAVAALGSTQIRVRAGTLVSPPVTVLVAEPAAGAVLVTDAQLVAGPTAVGTATPPDLAVGAKEQVSLTGVGTLAVGTIVLASEGKPVAGRVVTAVPAASGAADTVDVVLETVPLLELFKRLSVDGSYDVDPAALALALAPVPFSAPGSAPEIGVRRSPLMLGSKIKCETMLVAGALTGDGSFDLRPQMKLDYKFLKDDDTGMWTELMMKLDGTLSLTGTVSLDFSPMLAGSATCAAKLARIPIPLGGPLAAVVSLGIPLGLKGELAASVAVSPLKASLELRGTSNVKLGFRYTAAGGTTDLSDFSNKFEMEPTFTTPGAPGLILNASAAFGGTAGLDLSMLLGAGSLSLLEAALLLKAEVKASGYEAPLVFGGAYDLKPTLEAGAGEDAQKAMSWLGGAVALKATTTVTLPTIAQSPRGTFTADTLKVMQDQPVKLSVKLQPDTLDFLGLRNAVDVRIYRTKTMGAGLELVGTFGPDGTAEATFTPTLADRDAGGVTFWAGVTSKLMPGLVLEVNEMSALHVTVASMTDPRWKGTITTTCTEVRMDAPPSTDTQSETVTSTLMLEHETPEDAFMAKVKITASGMAAMKNTHDYSYSGSPGCTVQVHEELVGMATDVQPTIVQLRVDEVGHTWALVGGGSLVGTEHTVHTETGACKPGGMTTTISPDTKYAPTFGFTDNGTVAPGADHFSSTKMFPGDNPQSTCGWTLDFTRVGT